MTQIKFLKTRDVKNPDRANRYDAGIDFYVPVFNHSFIKALGEKNPWQAELKVMNLLEDKCFFLPPHQKVLIPSGIKCRMTDNQRALIAFNKSGVASKLGLVTGACVVDFEYQGEIHINVINTTDKPVMIEENQKLMQFVELPIITSEIILVEDEDTLFNGEITTRGASGFGDSDKKVTQLNS
jgi:dUTP pyrophosphatase